MNELNPGNVKVAIVMMRRASCTGDEALNVAQAIIAFEQLFESMAAAAQKQPKPTGGKAEKPAKRKGKK